MAKTQLKKSKYALRYAKRVTLAKQIGANAFYVNNKGQKVPKSIICLKNEEGSE